MKRLTLLLAVLAIGAGRAHAAPVSIGGTVLNGTTNQPWVGGTVELVALDDKGGHNQMGSVKTDASGRYTFPAATYGPEALMVVSAKYEGVGYWHVAFAGGRAATGGFKIYESSNKALPITFMAHHLAIETSSLGLKCVERIVVRNGTHQTLLGVGPNQVSVLLDIPKGARNVKLDPKTVDGKLVKTESGWGVSKKILPDEYSPTGEGFRPDPIIFNYEMDWPSPWPWSKQLDFSRHVLYPTSFFFVNRKPDDKELKVEAPLLSADQVQQVPIDGQTQDRLVNAVGQPMGPPSLKPDQELKITISRPAPASMYGFAALAVAICLFIPVAMARPKGGKGQRAKSEEPAVLGIVNGQTSTPGGFPEYSLTLNGFGTDLALGAESRELIEKIATLDDRREAGVIDEDEYRTQRVAWKKRLIELLGSPPE